MDLELALNEGRRAVIEGRHEDVVRYLSSFLGNASPDHPDYAECLRERSSALIALGKNDEAAADAAALIDLEPESPEGWLNGGWALENLGSRKEAIDAYSGGLARLGVDDFRYDGVQETIARLKTPPPSLENRIAKQQADYDKLPRRVETLTFGRIGVPVDWRTLPRQMEDTVEFLNPAGDLHLIVSVLQVASEPLEEPVRVLETLSATLLDAARRIDPGADGRSTFDHLESKDGVKMHTVNNTISMSEGSAVESVSVMSPEGRVLTLKLFDYDGRLSAVQRVAMVSSLQGGAVF